MKRLQKKSIFTIILTIAVISMLLFNQASAFQLLIKTASTTYSQKDNVKFQVSLDIGRDERVKIDSLFLEIFDPTDNLIKTCQFSTNGSLVSGCNNLIITQLNGLEFGYGYLYGYGYDAKGYGYGYSEGYFGYNGEVTYDISWNISTENLTTGNYSSHVKLKSGAREYQSNSWNFEISYEDNMPPSLVIVSPSEGETYHERNITIDLNVSDDVGIYRVWVNSLAWGAQEINYTGPFNISIPDGNHTIFAYARDLSNHINWTNVSFVVDARDKFGPNITIISPEPKNYTTPFIDVNFEANDTNLDSKWYYVDGRTYAFTGAETREFTYGSHVLFAFANDTEGNVNSTGVRFFVDIVSCTDFDNDGYNGTSASCPNGTDCNDRSSAIFPGATEACNGIDDDCDLEVDDILPESKPLCPMTQGVCSGATSSCNGVYGWVCNYGASYSTTDACSDSLDNNCNGVVNEGCSVCQNGATMSCGLTDTGKCSLGVRVCNNGQWGSCQGGVYPVVEVCGNSDDDDCDGGIDENCHNVNNNTVVCTEGATRECGETNIGACEKGTQTCTNNAWGACEGNINPVDEMCSDNVDNDCDGSVDEGCQAATGGNSGSGGRSSGSTTSGSGSSGSGAIVCFTKWECTSWSECLSGIQQRSCNDVNKCGTISDKPAEIQTCTPKNTDVVIAESGQSPPSNSNANSDNEAQVIQPKTLPKITKEMVFLGLLALIVIYYVILLTVFLKKRY